MSFAQILEELPKLSAPERREIFLQVLSLEPEVDDLAVCDHVAMEGFAMLEEMETNLVSRSHSCRQVRNRLTNQYVDRTAY
jgi:hypothetical protein